MEENINLNNDLTPAVIEKERMEVMTIKLNADYIGYTPEYKFCKGREKFIKFGHDNLMPQHTIKLRQSPTNDSLLDLKTILTAGAGFDVDEDNDELFDYCQRNNLDEVLERVSKDLITHGGFCVEAGWDSTGTYIAELKHIDFSFVRKENELVPQNFYLCYDWENYRKYTEEVLTIFNPATASQSNNQLFYYGNYSQGCNFYPKPDYAGFKFIEFEIMLGEFVFNNMSNGLSPSGIFNFKEVPTKQERELIKAGIRNDLSGPSNSGKFIALFSDGGEKAMEFIPLGVTNNADIYNALNNLAVQKIISAHHVPPSIANLPVQGGISFNNELSTAYEYYYNLNIPKYQKPILAFFNKVFKINKLIERKEKVQIKQIMPGQFKYDGNILGNSIFINEVRKAIGLAPVAEGETFVLPKGGNNQLPVNPTIKQLAPAATPSGNILKSPLI